MRLRRLGTYDALGLTAGLWFLAKFFRYAFPPLFPTFQAEFAVSNTLLGTAFSAMMLAYAAMQFPSGALADRFGAVRVIAVGVFITAGTGFILVFDARLVVLLGGMVFVGIGTGAHKTVAIRLLSRTYPQRTGRALGIFDTFGSFGGVVAPAIVVALASVARWRLVFLVGASASAVLLVGFLRRVPARLASSGVSAVPESAAGGSFADYLPQLREPAFLTFVAVNALFGFAFNGAVAFMPLYLVDATGLGEAVANLLYSGLFAVSLVQVLTGDLSDRIGERRVMGATLIVATAGLGGLLVVSGPILAGVFVLGVGIGSHGFRPVRGAYLVKLVPDSVAGGSMGLVRTVLMGSGAISPAVVGYVSDTVGYVAAFGLLAGSMAAATVAVGALSVLE